MSQFRGPGGGWWGWGWGTWPGPGEGDRGSKSQSGAGSWKGQEPQDLPRVRGGLGLLCQEVAVSQRRHLGGVSPEAPRETLRAANGAPTRGVACMEAQTNFEILAISIQLGLKPLRLGVEGKQAK